MNTRAFLLSATIAGAVMGLLGSLPILNLINCFLCIWVWLGGILAVWLYRRYQPTDPGLTPAQGAGLGAVAGLIGAVIGAVVFLITASLSIPMMESLARSLQIEGVEFQTGGIGGVLIQTLIFFVADIVLYPLFGALAGLLAAGVFWKRAPAPF